MQHGPIGAKIELQIPIGLVFHLVVEIIEADLNSGVE